MALLDALDHTDFSLFLGQLLTFSKNTKYREIIAQVH